MSTKAKRIYMDYASTTPVDPAVEKEMERFWNRDFGNPGSIHAEGNTARLAFLDARTRLARCIEAHSDEIIFTSGGTEANNLAILGSIETLIRSGRNAKDLHVLVSKIEHSSVLECFKELSRRGVVVEYVPVTEEGSVKPEVLSKMMRPNTVLVSIQYVNSEIGVIQPMRKLAQVIEKVKQAALGRPQRVTLPLFHVDASQAPLYLNVTQHFLGADLITFDAQKMYGPKGIGMLYVRRGTALVPYMYGGGQEKGLRPGTENVPLVAGFAKAFELATARREKDTLKVKRLRDHAIEKILKEVPSAELNGSLTDRVANNINISIQSLDSEFAVLTLDAAGFAVSSKSACDASDSASPTILALGKSEAAARSTLRFTLGRSSTLAEVDQLVRALAKIVRSSSALA